LVSRARKSCCMQSIPKDGNSFCASLYPFFADPKSCSRLGRTSKRARCDRPSSEETNFRKRKTKKSEEETHKKLKWDVYYRCFQQYSIVKLYTTIFLRSVFFTTGMPIVPAGLRSPPTAAMQRRGWRRRWRAVWSGCRSCRACRPTRVRPPWRRWPTGR